MMADENNTHETPETEVPAIAETPSEAAETQSAESGAPAGHRPASDNTGRIPRCPILAANSRNTRSSAGVLATNSPPRA